MCELAWCKSLSSVWWCGSRVRIGDEEDSFDVLRWAVRGCPEDMAWLETERAVSKMGLVVMWGGGWRYW